MVTYLGASPADTKVTVTRGAHARFTYLKALLRRQRNHRHNASEYEMAGDVASMHMYQD
jgi:hypothetical protein